jgi:hypothetical protein
VTTFDPEAGVLRLSDHATAPPLARLRAAGVVGPTGIHPDVRPLATVIGAPHARLDLHVAERGTAWDAPGWASRDLVVLAVPAVDAEDAYDLVADLPASAADLLADLVGLSGALPHPSAATPAWESPGARTGPVSVEGAALDALLPGRVDDVAPPAGPAALRRLLAGLRARWRLAVREPGDGAVEVLDAGELGLWLVDGPDEAGALELRVSSPAEVRTRTAALLRRALG